jgi:hypothetical protein
MMEAGSAYCVMGNHEFNAIAWATPDPDDPGEFLRPHGRPGNKEQHQAFLSEAEGTPKHGELIAWFKTLPLWLDLGGLRIVHACWHEASMDQLLPLMGRNQTLTDELIVLGSRKDHWAYKAIETICKGPEVELPPGISIKDKEGKVRTEVRVRWWQEDLSTYRKAAIGPPGEIEMIPDVPMPAEWVGHPYSGVPVCLDTIGLQVCQKSFRGGSRVWITARRETDRLSRIGGMGRRIYLRTSSFGSATGLAQRRK